mmetsp:Transcript_69254/g.122531  ORF Transcript_69254/g.122531 Transcript_69254/m.122531 type:complete len:224 (+) Transcript_69254:671-1342(+)
MFLCQQNWVQACRHSSSPDFKPLPTSLMRPLASSKSILLSTGCGWEASSASAPAVGGAPATAFTSASRLAATPLLALGAGLGGAVEAFGLVPTALKARAATASQRSRMMLPPAPEASRTSKASSFVSSSRSVEGLRLCGGHSLRLGRPRLPSSVRRWSRNSSNARAKGQPAIGQSRSGNCKLCFALPAAGLFADLLTADTNATCKSSFSFSTARRAANERVAL